MTAGVAAGPAAPPARRGDPTPFRFGDAGAVGVLLIHGWSGSPAEMRGLGTYLAERGLVVDGVRLPGHGTNPRDLHHVSWRHWAAACGQALDALRAACPTVFVGGLSMGGLLSLYLAGTTHPPVAGVIALSAPIYLPGWQMRALPVLKHVVRWYTKSGSDLVDPTAVERLWHYPGLPTHSIHQLALVAREARQVLPQIRVPLLIMQGRRDRTIAPGCAAYLYAHAGSADKTLVYLDESGHGITEDLERATVWREVYGFISRQSPVTRET